MKQMGFMGAMFFSGKDTNLIINKVLADLATTSPHLTSVELTAWMPEY